MCWWIQGWISHDLFLLGAGLEETVTKEEATSKKTAAAHLPTLWARRTPPLCGFLLKI